ncbi:MAG: hypothetical protein ACKVP7_21960 [Hyphomicrobiaceae bacterium]
MTKIEQLTTTAAALPDDQIDELIAYARYLQAEPFFYSASPEALASLERGIAEAEAGNVRPAAEVFQRIRDRIAARS